MSDRPADPRPNWFERSVEKLVEESRSFFWDAVLALGLNGITGDYAEFGSWGAKSLSIAHDTIASMGHGRHLWAFDSFQGLPVAASEHDEHPVWRSGGQGNDFLPTSGADPAADPAAVGLAQFREACERFGVPESAYTPVVGYFEDSLPPLGADGDPSDIALAYVDCNMHSSTVTVLDFLAPRLKHGMIIAFDDFNLWSPTDVSGQRRALHDFARDNPQWRFRPFKDIHWAGCSFVVERADLLTGA